MSDDEKLLTLFVEGCAKVARGTFTPIKAAVEQYAASHPTKAAYWVTRTQAEKDEITRLTARELLLK